MASSHAIRLAREADIGLHTLVNRAGLAISLLPNGTVFAIGHRDPKAPVTINQVLGSPVYGGIGRLLLRCGGGQPAVHELVGPAAHGDFAAGQSGAVWTGRAGALAWRVTLRLHPDEPVWFWQVELENVELEPGLQAPPCDVVLVQDVGLGGRGFLMGSEAYVSQYLDHFIARHPSYGPVVMSRQNLAQNGHYPWLAQGCIEGALHFATDAVQFLGPDFRVSGRFAQPYGVDLPSVRRQHEVGCIALQSGSWQGKAGETCQFTFFAMFRADHPSASSAADLNALGDMESLHRAIPTEALVPVKPVRSCLQDAQPLNPEAFDLPAIAARWPMRRAEEWQQDRLVSFFTPEGQQNRHIVLADKERQVARRHGALLRSGQSFSLDDSTLCATAWMHGVFAAQLTIGNTSFHKLFSVSRDPYNITRASGLRILVDTGTGWQLLAVPSAFEIGLGDARWIYCLPGRTITIHAVAAGDAPAMQWRIKVDGRACRFLVFGHVVMGERDYEQTGQIMVDQAAGRITFTPSPGWLWGQSYPQAAYHLVTSTPAALDRLGGDELLYEDGVPRAGPYIALRTLETCEFVFAVTGSMTDAAEGEKLAAGFTAGPSDEALLAPQRRFWSHVTRDLQLGGSDPLCEAQDLFLPWLAHDAMIHLTTPHGLEQYTGAAWGTRDVCQGPVEFLLALEHDEAVKDILCTLFGEQSHERGDWPQWFMLEPYAAIRAGDSHGDVIVWPLKALCDYIEATGNLDILDQQVPWRDSSNRSTAHTSPIRAHIDRLLASVEAAFIPGTSLMRYGEGDWNDSLQPADPHLRDWMVSSWTVSLLYEQVVRYGHVLERAGDAAAAAAMAALAGRMHGDFTRYLMRDGLVAGYGLFSPSGGDVELLLHPSDTRTGLSFSLIAMTQPIIGGLFTDEQAKKHLDMIDQHLLFPDGVRLMDKPATYNGGPEKLFRRAESSSFFGREIGLMYVHAHVRYCEALARMGDAEALWQALALINPIAVTLKLEHATPRQRNTYFSSSDAAFTDRYAASAEWDRVKAATVPVDGGWRIYSSGPGLYTRAIVELVLGRRRHFGKRIDKPLLPALLR